MRRSPRRRPRCRLRSRGHGRGRPCWERMKKMLRLSLRKERSSLGFVATSCRTAWVKRSQNWL